MQVSGIVQTKSGVGVPGVLVKFCRIDPLSKSSAIDANFCPLIKFKTDNRGTFSGEIRVSSISFNNTEEHFNVTAYKTEILADGSSQVHVFNPQYGQIFHFTQATYARVKIIDTTAVSIFGNVLFDLNNAKGYSCPIEGVPVFMTLQNDATSSTRSAIDGTFTFSIGIGDSARIYIPAYQNRVWTSIIVNNRSRLEVGNSHRRLAFSEDEIFSFSSFSQEQAPEIKSSISAQKNFSSLQETGLPVCYFGGYCAANRICIKGTKCVTTSSYYSQCLLEPSQDRKGDCSINYQACSSNKPCCSDAFFCDPNSKTCEAYNGPPNCVFIPQYSVPSSQPSRHPSKQHVHHPSYRPSRQPSRQPIHKPTKQPFHRPSKQPSRQPSSQPSHQPTVKPSLQPVKRPTSQPKGIPTIQPSRQPSSQPKQKPSCQPTMQPTTQPSSQPTRTPTRLPSFQPTNQPTVHPNRQPSHQPSSRPSNQPSFDPSSQPSG